MIFLVRPKICRQMQVKDPEKIDQYYQALLDRDERFVGTFYVGVKTTSIFCIASCRARKPKPENVTFYTDVKTALDHGFRPCKICKPTEHAHQAPEEVLSALQLLKKKPKEKITDECLKAHEISPELVRRWFNKHYGMTFHAYQRMLRINTAYQELQQGKNATQTAYDNGYDSLSGFGYTYKKIMGQSPSKSKDTTTIVMSRLTTPIGPMFVCATSKGICLLEFVDRKMLETEFSDLQRRLQAPIIIGENSHIQQLKQELSEYFIGTRKQFNAPLHTPTTPFRQRVWDALLEIPYGETRSYQEQAVFIDNPQAVRAVAAANGHNRVAIVIPCHRVIGKNGKLTGYAGGLERKRWLLDHESKHLNQLLYKS